MYLIQIYDFIYNNLFIVFFSISVIEHAQLQAKSKSWCNSRSANRRTTVASSVWILPTTHGKFKRSRRPLRYNKRHSFPFKTSQFAQFWTHFFAQSSRAIDDVRAAQQIHQCRQIRGHSTTVSAINSNWIVWINCALIMQSSLLGIFYWFSVCWMESLRGSFLSLWMKINQKYVCSFGSRTQNSEHRTMTHCSKF